MGSQTELAIQRLNEGWSLERVLDEAQLPELGKYLMQFVYKKNITIDALAGLADMNRSTVYRICDNKMHPSSNKLIRLSRVLEMNLADTQRLLKCGNLATLSGEKPRDLIIMNGIMHQKSWFDISEELVTRGFPDLLTNR